MTQFITQFAQDYPSIIIVMALVGTTVGRKLGQVLLEEYQNAPNHFGHAVPLQLKAEINLCE